MRRAVLAVAAVSFTVLVGCTSVNDGTAKPVTTTNGASTSTATSESKPDKPSTGEAPAVTGPELDLGKLSGPCDLLKADQLAARGITKPGAKEDDLVGPTCQWEPDDPGRGTSIGGTIMTNADGLNSAYARRSQFPVFQPIEVAGYPALNTDLLDGKHGECTTSVAVAEGKAFMIQIAVNDQDSAAYTAPCSVGAEVAALVVGNLKG
ncbi:DUF3558 domain-containing protein [Saccharothrix hoggarensis]|uniref:DUF3558 domain-containing protein n=1 Tax=Saccharothrix hoggarensis TaxID=913853 RepID=A0ABW3R5T0_9PSEU